MNDSDNTQHDNQHDNVIFVDVDGDGCIVVRGEIDMAGGPVLEAVILQREQMPVTIDVSGVSFIDSSGLRALLGAARRAASQDGWVTLRDVSPEVARLLEITGTTSMFRLEPAGG